MQVLLVLSWFSVNIGYNTWDARVFLKLLGARTTATFISGMLYDLIFILVVSDSSKCPAHAWALHIFTVAKVSATYLRVVLVVEIGVQRCQLFDAWQVSNWGFGNAVVLLVIYISWARLLWWASLWGLSGVISWFILSNQFKMIGFGFVSGCVNTIWNHWHWGSISTLWYLIWAFRL